MENSYLGRGCYHSPFADHFLGGQTYFHQREAHSYGSASGGKSFEPEGVNRRYLSFNLQRFGCGYKRAGDFKPARIRAEGPFQNQKLLCAGKILALIEEKD